LSVSDLLREFGVMAMIAECRAKGCIAEWFVFGSASRGVDLPSDIDVLCVVKSDGEIERISSICSYYLMQAPIHLRLLSEKDEVQLAFIRRSNAISVGKFLF
jgi:predicted nucleotidyltransferase